MSLHAKLEPVRFGEFLRDRKLISEEQWLAALADHWSNRRQRIGMTIIDNGYLSAAVVEAEARTFHDDLDIVDVIDADVISHAEVTSPAISVRL